MMSSGESNVTYGDCYPSFTSDRDCDIILGFRRAVGILSMCCCLFIIFVIVLYKKYRFLSQRLILYLTISAFFQAIGYIVVDYRIAHWAETENRLESLCRFQGWWTLFFDWMSFVWVCCITFNVFWNAVFLKRTEKFEKFYFLVDLAVPIVISILPFIGLSYGPAGLWCWISSRRNGKNYVTGIILQFLLFYGPFWLLCIVQLVLLVIVFFVIRKRVRTFQGQYDPSTGGQRKMWQEEIKPLMAFPLIYMFILIFPSMNRIRYAAGYDNPSSAANFFFWFAHSVTLTLHGTVYALVFSCDKRTMSRLRWHKMKAAMFYWAGMKGAKEYPAVMNINSTAKDTADPTDFLQTTVLSSYDNVALSNEDINSRRDVDYERM